jgi:hypothetical protein
MEGNKPLTFVELAEGDTSGSPYADSTSENNILTHDHPQ